MTGEMAVQTPGQPTTSPSAIERELDAAAQRDAGAAARSRVARERLEAEGATSGALWAAGSALAVTALVAVLKVAETKIVPMLIEAAADALAAKLNKGRS